MTLSCGGDDGLATATATATGSGDRDGDVKWVWFLAGNLSDSRVDRQTPCVELRLVNITLKFLKQDTEGFVVYQGGQRGRVYDKSFGV